MDDHLRAKIIAENPIGTGLDTFRAAFERICESKGFSCSLESLDHLDRDDLQEISIVILSSLLGLRASRLLPAERGSRTLVNDLSRLFSTITDDSDFEYKRIQPLLQDALAIKSDSDIWRQAYDAVTEYTPPPRTIASSLQQTPWLRNTSSFVNSSEHRKYVDGVLKEELGPLYVGLRDFQTAFFGGVADLDSASEATFKRCKEGESPLFDEGWQGWPDDANEKDVLQWFAYVSSKLAEFAEEYCPDRRSQRRPLAKPNQPIDGSVGKRKLDVGFVSDPSATQDSRCHWSQILVPGELKSNPVADKASEAWLDLGRYAREVLAAQDTRRFVLGFTICGSVMRIWMFDRLGGIASDQFDINEDGPRFVFTILGFLWMDEVELGFDPSIKTSNGQRFIEIERDDLTERIIIDGVMQRARCIAGRATTCWKAHSEGKPQKPLVIKDSWQYTERPEEGELVCEATAKGVVNVARYYHHETVQVRGMDDDIRRNVRKDLDITKAENYGLRRSTVVRTSGTVVSREGRSIRAGVKRPSSQTGSSLPPSKRSCSTSPIKIDRNGLPNRIHRRLIVRDYGKPIYRASSPAALLGALEGCVDGHESLYKAGFLHRDISINNLMINEANDNPSWRAFVIDLDLAIKEQRVVASGAKGKTGTRAFMAIGALLGEQHSFMHDLESFFWVLFWICVHYSGPDESRVIPRFEKWNYVDTEELARIKKGEVSHEGDFIRSVEENFTGIYQPLIPWVNRLRKAIFPNGGRWEKEDSALYARMRNILQEARQDPTV
ncbi:kinase-like domain [Apiospora arundinis]|uniref:non-specific serine/threonine protein kinase n=1 Tax=Apiospora arundinis TaxID=335852 RepID=A0ABR2J473_9PEZI